MDKKTLYIFRHGQTDWNKQRRLQGHADISLNEEGRTQARSLQEFFKTYPVEKVFSSDLDRAVETAALATQVAREQIILRPDLREVRLGVLEGVYEEKFVAEYGEENIARWRSLDDEHRHFAFEGGESRHECNTRMEIALQEICVQHSFNAAAICSHGFAMRRLFHHFLEEKIIPPMIQNCVVFELEYQKIGDRSVFTLIS